MPFESEISNRHSIVPHNNEHEPTVAQRLIGEEQEGESDRALTATDFIHEFEAARSRLPRGDSPSRIGRMQEGESDHAPTSADVTRWKAQNERALANPNMSKWLQEILCEQDLRLQQLSEQEPHEQQIKNTLGSFEV